MKVLLTGAFGNIGSNTLRELIKNGHTVTCFDLKNRRTVKMWRRFKNCMKTIWGDIRNREDVSDAVKDQDVVLHLAAIIPPRSEIETDVSEETNITGTRNLIHAIKALSRPPRLLFTSSVSVFGRKIDTPPPRKVGEELSPTDNYSRHKIICEDMILNSGLTYCILRCPAMPSLESMSIDPLMFDISLDTRIEFLDPRDAGSAIANTVISDEVWGKIMLLGGGENEQYTYCEYVGKTLDSVGIGRLPCEAFGTEPFYTDWVDSDESQRLLSYQRHTLDDFLDAYRQNLGVKRYLLPLMRPLIRRYLLAKSSYLPPGVGRGHKPSSYWRERVAMVTGASSGIGAVTARLLSVKGLRVALIARRVHKLDEVAQMIKDAGGEAITIPCDLSNEDEREKAVNEVYKKWGKIDVLINNAGYTWYGYGADMPWETARSMIDVNVTAVAHLTMLVLRRMRSLDSGHVINVSSIAGSFPQQGIMMYGASKAFVDNLTTSLYREMKGTNVHISCVKPGAVATEMYRTAEKLPGARALPAEGLAVKVEKVANRIWRLLNRPRRRVFVPRFLWIVPWVEMLFGWFIDLLGPVLLRLKTSPSKSTVKV